MIAALFLSAALHAQFVVDFDGVRTPATEVVVWAQERPVRVEIHSTVLLVNGFED